MVKYMSHYVEYNVSDDEFISDARRHYGYDVPTFRQAIRHLIHSLYRDRYLASIIPDVQAAFEHNMTCDRMACVEHNGIELKEDWEKKYGK